MKTIIRRLTSFLDAVDDTADRLNKAFESAVQSLWEWFVAALCFIVYAAFFIAFYIAVPVSIAAVVLACMKYLGWIH